MLFAGAASALAWDYFFLPPKFTFIISSTEDGVLFGLYFVVALVLGQFVARIRAQELAERRREERATALYQLTRELAQAGTRDEVVWQLVGEVSRVFQAPVAVVLPAANGLAAHPDSSLTLSDKELNVAVWAFRNRQAAGKFTDNLPGSENLHLPLATERALLGVLSLNLPDKNLPLARRDLLEAYARQAALVLDRVALARRGRAWQAGGGIRAPEQCAAQLHLARTAHPAGRHHQRHWRAGGSRGIRR